MTILAMGLLREVPPHVLDVCNGIEVIRIYAALNSAPVVNF